jgi:FHA domain
VTALCPACARRYDFPTAWLKGQDGMARCGKCGCRFPVHRPVPQPAGAPSAPPRAAPAGGAAAGMVSASAARAPVADAAGMTRVGREASAGGEGALPPHVRIALTGLDGPVKDQVFQISRGPVVIGRAEGDIRVPDPKVSGRHAQVELTGGEAWLRDLGSTTSAAPTAPSSTASGSSWCASRTRTRSPSGGRDCSTPTSRTSSPCTRRSAPGREPGATSGRQPRAAPARDAQCGADPIFAPLTERQPPTRRRGGRPRLPAPAGRTAWAGTHPPHTRGPDSGRSRRPP